MADNYVLHVTAGPGYEYDSQVEVPVNTPQPVKISSPLADMEVCVRVQDYKGLPRDSPTTSPYFKAEPHAYNQDQYSIALRFTPKKPEETKDADGDAEAASKSTKNNGINGIDLQFGNDFDHAIRDRLPPGFNTAMNIVKWWIDPGLEGDAYADRPYLYGPALSSFNAVRVGAAGPETFDESRGGLWFEEGGDDYGKAARAALGTPAAGKARMKWALRDDSKRRWVYEYGQTYGFDFYNPYLDFTNLALRLPGFQLPIIKYWDGQSLRSGKKRSHQLRYVLRNRATDQTYLVVLFTLYHKDYVNEDGSLREGARASLHPDSAASKELAAAGDGADKHDEAAALQTAREALGPKVDEESSGGDKDKEVPAATNTDDVD